MRSFDAALLLALKESRYEKLYVNVVRFAGGTWGICWYEKWCAANTRTKAVAQRREFIAYLQKEAPDIWDESMVKTIRIL